MSASALGLEQPANRGRSPPDGGLLRFVSRSYSKEDHMHDAGSCHCGRIAFDLKTEATLTEAYDCNC
ncbi:hypothetical protein EYR27_03830 [Xanthomonas oryzae]|nr:hypothetical protein EYR27_03830 [Xanthomonas oryzae]